MVSGGRGTGKTSLLLTLQREVIRASAATRAGSPNGLTDLQQRIVWLETLDLEPLPVGTGLMAAIMGLIEQAVDEDSIKDDLGLRRPQTDSATTMQDLSNLSLDVCLAWDPDYPRLGGSTDTDLYARELMRVEKARTNLQPRFAKLLNDLAASVPWKSCMRKPLFVLPVDDIDLNPARCLELLRLIRSFRTPRFVVLLFGDYEVARLVVNLSFLEEFSRLLPRPDATRKVRANIDGQAFRLGVEAIRKMLPPNQRFHIESVSVPEALLFPPNEDRIESIGTLLGKIDVPYKLYSSPTKLSLAEWVSGGSHWPEGNAPSAGLAFTTTLRKLADLWIRLEELTSGDTDEALDKLIATLWVEFQRGLVEDGVVTGRKAQDELDYTPDAALAYGPFRLDFAPTPEVENEIPSPRASRLQLRFPGRALLVATPKTEMPTGLPTPQTLGRAVLLHDLMKLTGATAFNPLVIPQVQTLGLVRLDWQLEVGGTACSVAWPAPTLATAWELELFLALWAKFRSSLSDVILSNVSRDELIPASTFWLALCGAFAFESEALWKIVGRSLTGADNLLKGIVTEYGRQAAAPSQTAGKRSNRRLAADVDQPAPTAGRAADWLLRTAAFLSCESYIDPSVAEAFHANEKLKSYWSGPSRPLNKQVIQDHRRRTTRKRSSGPATRTGPGRNPRTGGSGGSSAT